MQQSKGNASSVYCSGREDILKKKVFPLAAKTAKQTKSEKKLKNFSALKTGNIARMSFKAKTTEMFFRGHFT